MFKKTLLESIYWTVITIAGVGYSQSVDVEVPESRQLLSIVVILVGMLVMAYTIGMLIQAIVEGQLDKAMGAKRMTKEIDKLKNHVIVCGFGRIGQNLTIGWRAIASLFLSSVRTPTRSPKPKPWVTSA